MRFIGHSRLKGWRIPNPILIRPRSGTKSEFNPTTGPTPDPIPIRLRSVSGLDADPLSFIGFLFQPYKLAALMLQAPPKAFSSLNSFRV